MPIFYLFLAMLFSALVTVGSQLYNDKNPGVANITRLYSLLCTLSGTILWLVLWLADFSFDAKVLPYAVLYSITFSFFTFGTLGAVKNGPTSLTALIKQVSLVCVAFWGFAFWGTQFTIVSGLGIVLLGISLCLCLLVKEEKASATNMKKFLFYCGILAVGNAGCAIIQYYQQLVFNYQHRNMFMFFAFAFSSLLCLLLTLRENKANWKSTIKRSWLFPALSGGGGALSILFMLLLVKLNMSPVILYPGVAVGGLLITILFSVFLFREKLRPQQWLGLFIGAISLVLLNL